MEHQEHQELPAAPSRRYIRAYLIGWAVLATGALGYLATLAWQPEQLAPAQTKPNIVEPDQGLRAASKALAEVGTLRQTVEGLQKDVGELKESTDQRGEQEKAVQSRLAALEEKVAAIPGPIVTTVTSSAPPTAKQKAAEKVAEKAAEKAAATKSATVVKPALQKQPGARVINVEETPGPTSANTRSRLETGSIQAGAGFGEVVVTRAGDTFAVQLDAAPSIDVLRLRWSLLLDRYGDKLGNLQPRFVAPGNPGGPYRLVAGPIASAADAKDICAELRAQIPVCSTTEFIGEPL